jgi:hypothetical protein
MILPELRKITAEMMNCGMMSMENIPDPSMIP